MTNLEFVEFISESDTERLVTIFVSRRAAGTELAVHDAKGHKIYSRKPIQEYESQFLLYRFPLHAGHTVTVPSRLHSQMKLDADVSIEPKISTDRFALIQGSVDLIVDDLTRWNFTRLADANHITMENFFAEIEASEAKTLFFEPAWHGWNHSWRGFFRNSTASNIAKWNEMTDFASSKGKQIVCFSKEDPIYQEKFQAFSSAADLILTPSISSLQKYQSDGRQYADLCPFFVNPEFFNPFHDPKTENEGVARAIYVGSRVVNSIDRFDYIEPEKCQHMKS